MPNTREFWLEFLSANYEKIKKEAGKIDALRDFDLIDDAAQYVCVKLLADDMKSLKKYEGRGEAKPETYFFKVVNNKLIDFLRKEKRVKNSYYIPKWLKKQDNFLWIQIHKLLCHMGIDENSVIDYMAHSGSSRRLSAIHEAIRVVLKQFPDCAKGDPVRLPEEALENIDDGAVPIENLLGKEQWRYIIKLFVTDKNSIPNLDNTGIKKLEQIKKKVVKEFKPTARERLFLRLVCQEGKSVSEAGRDPLIGWNVNQAHQHKDNLIGRLKNIFENDLRELVDI